MAEEYPAWMKSKSRLPEKRDIMPVRARGFVQSYIAGKIMDWPPVDLSGDNLTVRD